MKLYRVPIRPNWSLAGFHADEVLCGIAACILSCFTLPEFGLYRVELSSCSLEGVSRNPDSPPAAGAAACVPVLPAPLAAPPRGARRLACSAASWAAFFSAS